MKHTQFRCHKAARYTDAEKTIHDDTIVVLRVVKEDLWWSTKSKNDALGILKDALRVIKDYDQRTFHSVISFSVRNELVSMICFVCKMQILLQQKADAEKTQSGEEHDDSTKGGFHQQGS